MRKAFWLELAAVFLLSAELALITAWRTLSKWLPPDTEGKKLKFTLTVIITVAALIFTVLLIITVRKLLKLNMKSAIIFKLKLFFARLSGFVIRKLEQWGFLKSPDAIQGQIVSEFDISPTLRKKSRFSRPPRWSKAKTAREKLAYLYYKLITKKIKEGMPAKASDTPLELRHRSENSEPEQTVFNRYISARYNEKTALSDSEMAALKKELFNSDI